MAGELVGPEVFRKWQAVLNNSRVVERIRELRGMAVKMSPPPTMQIADTLAGICADMHQADLLTNFLIDMNHAEPLESDSVVKVDGPMETA